MSRLSKCQAHRVFVCQAVCETLFVVLVPVLFQSICRDPGPYSQLEQMHQTHGAVIVMDAMDPIQMSWM